MERYRSGHNGADSKSVCANAHEGSNPSLSAKSGFKPRKEAAGQWCSAAFQILKIYGSLGELYKKDKS